MPIDTRASNERASEKLAAFNALLLAAIPDPAKRLTVIHAAVDYAHARAIAAIDDVIERQRARLATDPRRAL